MEYRSMQRVNAIMQGGGRWCEPSPCRLASHGSIASLNLSHHRRVGVSAAKLGKLFAIITHTGWLDHRPDTHEIDHSDLCFCVCLCVAWGWNEEMRCRCAPMAKRCSGFWASDTPS